MITFNKYLNKRTIIAVVLLILLTTLFFSIEAINRNKTKALLDELQYDSYLAKAYNPLIRQTLFKLVVEGENYQYAKALGKELSDSLSAISYRTMLHQDEMNSKWQGYFISEVDNLGIMLKNKHYSLLNEDFFCFLGNHKSPTPAEKDVLEELYRVWLKADDFSKENNLEHISYSREISKDFTHFKSFEIYNQPSANLLAEHMFILTRDMAKIPRTINHLIYDVTSFTNFLLSDYQNDRNFSINSKEIASDLVDILRQHNFQKVKEVNALDLKLFYKVRYTQSGRVRVLKIYDQCIQLEGNFGNYYIYPPIMWTNIGDKYGGVSPSEWDYKGNEFGDFPEIEGFYKVNSNLHEDIRQLINSHDLISDYGQ